jgi:DCC1-like thiol-disulfide oxidoreductase
MGQIVRRERYSYRHDPSVPEFDDSGPITFMDGDCTLCSTGARLIARLDRCREFRICPVQTPLGKAVLTLTASIRMILTVGYTSRMATLGPRWRP